MCGHTCGLQDNEGEKLGLGRRVMLFVMPDDVI